MKNKTTTKTSIFSTRYFRICLLILFALVNIGPYLHPIASGLDPSWMLACNSAADWSLKFGSDINFTYGPLGFVCNTIPIGNNFTVSCFIWISMFILQIWLLWQTFFKMPDKHVSSATVLSLVLWAAACRLSFDYFLLNVVILALSVAWFGKTKMFGYIAACLLTVLSLFIKFSMVLSCLSGVVLFFIFDWVYYRKLDRRLMLALLCIPFVFALAYLLYNPSLSGMMQYFRLGLQISSGYNAAMSVVCGAKYYVSAFFIGLSVIVIIIFLLYDDKHLALYLLSLSGFMFVAFKHGFVRADGHISIFFQQMLAIFSIILLFVNYKRLLTFQKKEKFKRLRVSLSCILLSFSLMICFIGQLRFGFKPIRNYAERVTSFLNIGNFAEVQYAGDDKLPQDFTAEIGDKSVTVYPWEISYSAFNKLQGFRPMPVLQAYSVYTSELDSYNARFFSDAEQSPEYIIFSLDTIDNRWPLIECPQTWSAIREHYYCVNHDTSTGLLLLKRCGNFKPQSYVSLEERSENKNAIIKLPLSDEPIAMKLDMELNVLGKLAKFLFRIPYVFLTVHYEAGDEITRRVIPDVLNSYFIISESGITHPIMAAIMNGDDVLKYTDDIVSVNLNGPGMIYYCDDIKLSFAKNVLSKQLPEDAIAISLSSTSDMDRSKINADEMLEVSVDTLHNAKAESETDRINVTAGTAFSITGWCVNKTRGLSFKATYIEVGDILFNLSSVSRPDVADYFGNSDYTDSGFSGIVDVSALAPGEYNCAFVGLNEDGSYVRNETPWTLLIE